MDEQSVQFIIEEYIKNNLRVELETNYSYGDTRQEVIATVYLGDDVVSSGEVYIDKDYGEVL